MILWLVKKDQSAFVADQAKEALNFQLTLLIVFAVIGVLGIITCGFGLLLLPIPAIVGLVFSILGAVAANKGEAYRYPICFRMVQ